MTAAILKPNLHSPGRPVGRSILCADSAGSRCTGSPRHGSDPKSRTRGRWANWLGGLLGVLGILPAAALDLSRAVVVSPPDLGGPERQAVRLLIDEIEKRSQIRLAEQTSWPTSSVPVIAVGPAPALKALGGDAVGELGSGQGSPKPEGFTIRTVQAGAGAAVCVAGNDARGVLYGVGYFLRQLQLAPGKIAAPDGLAITTAPRYALRGHQLGYRPKTHAYDAWDVPTWEQYYRDLIVFGVNAVELIPPRSDDDADSPHFPLPPIQMMRRMSQLADDYGLDVWIWYPAMDADYSDPATVARALDEWGAVFAQLPRIDAVFVPGGDPGHTRPRVLLDLLAKETEVLHRTHPHAQMWVSPQSFNQAWLDEFLGILTREQPAWLSGVVFGPQIRLSLPALRQAVPARYPIRHYPDITHTRQCQYPVPDWDTAFAVTEGRECIDPRPTDEAAIFRLLQPGTVGFITYSEGCNDDVNKIVWSALGWDPDQPVIRILREYSRYFIGDAYTDDFAQGLLALERNWRGPLLANEGVETTLQQFQQLERAAAPRALLNWRFQQALFRAYYDTYLRRRLLYETTLENEALDQLREAPRVGPQLALSAAESTLDRALTQPTATALRARVFELGEALYQSIRMQLSVPRYHAIAVDRGACLDTLDYPLNDRRWLKERFAEIRRLPTAAAQLAGLREIVDWTDPGPGGFYDDLGNIARQPHLVRGLPFDQDPASLVSSKVGFEEGDVVDEPDEKPEGALRCSWLDHAESLCETPLQVHYDDLDPHVRYKVRIVYGGDSPKLRIRLEANDGIEIHPFRDKRPIYRPVEFDLPPAATRTGSLTLTWHREPGLGGNGRGCQVAELWLIKCPDTTNAPNHP